MLTSRGRETAEAASAPGLIADIGGTNVRFGLVDPEGRIHETVSLRCSAFRNVDSAAESYLQTLSGYPRPRRAAFAVASPVIADQVALTNHRWAFSIAAVRERLGLERLTVLNDFAAVALAVPHLDDGDVEPVGAPSGDGADADARLAFPIAVIGPGTGLGVAGLVPGDGGWHTIASEGGHVTMSAADEREAQVLEILRWTYDHVSAERVISGPGLVNLYNALSEMAKQRPDDIAPDEITERALDGTDPVCAEALQMFCAMLGTVTGDLCLTFGARGGAYIAGGIVPKLGDYVVHSAFRHRFEAKGRMDDYMAGIPTWVVTADLPAFIGLAGIVRRD